MQRVVKKTGESITYYAGDLYQATFNGDVASHRYRVEAGGRTVAELTLDESATDVAFVTRYLHDDVLGSTDTISGPATTTQRFSPFGESANGVPSAATPYGFTGQEHDTEFGLINMRGRIYDPIAHQFLSADPFIASSGVGFNRFAYVNNSPLNHTDPSGFLPEDVPWIDIAGRNQSVEFADDFLTGIAPGGTAGVAPGVDAGAGAGVGAGWGGPATTGAGGGSGTGIGTAIGTAANLYNAANTMALEASGPASVPCKTIPTERVGQAAGAGAPARAPDRAWGAPGQEGGPSQYKGDWRTQPAPQLAQEVLPYGSRAAGYACHSEDCQEGLYIDIGPIVSGWRTLVDGVSSAARAAWRLLRPPPAPAVEEILSNQAAGKIIGWPTGQAAAEQTAAMARGLTSEQVAAMRAQGLNRATVESLRTAYQRAIQQGGKKLLNTQLLPRAQLMDRILELWPK
jgi:RHS repeat-associated protein